MHKPLSGCLLVSDVDGTLVNKALQIPPVNTEAIRRFTELGGLFTLASGRSFSAVRLLAERVENNCPVIAYNGAAVYDLKKQEIVWQLHLPESAKRYVADVMEKFPDIGVEIHSEGKLYLVRDSAQTTIHLQDESLTAIPCAFEDLPDIPWNKVLYAAPGDRLRALRAFAEANPLPGAYHIFTSPIYFEMIPENANKGTALRALTRHLGLDIANVFAIGDYFNDIDLLKAAGHAAAVAHAPEEVRKVADFITVSNEEGAVADYIDHIVRTRFGR